MLSPRASAFYGRLGLGFFALALAVVLFTFDDYGVTWDAPYHMTNGENVVAYYASWFTDRRVLTYHNLFLYGGAYDALAELAREILPFGDYETNHLVNALVGLLGVAGCWKLADFLAGRRAALFAALLLLAVPAWYGHSFNNPKDIPFAAGMAWSLYYAARFVAALPLPTGGLTAKLGLALGLTLGVRVGGVLAIFYLATGIAGYLLLRWSAVRPAALMREAGQIAVSHVLPALGIAYVLMLLCWPWAQQQPLGNPIAALRLFSHIDWDLKVLFEGRLVDSMHLPATYLPVYFAVTLPELVLVLLAAAPPLAVYGIATGRLGIDRRLRPAYAMLATAIAFPFLYFIVMRPVTYDTIRHFLFVLPPLAIVAGIVGDRLWGWAAGRPLAPRAGLAAGLALWAVWHVATMVRLHPDQYVYYNALVGGVKGAEDRFELDYWGNSYAEAVERLADRLAREEVDGTWPRHYYIAVCSSGTSASYFFPPNMSLASSEMEADFYISVTRLGCDKELQGKEIVRVERDGALLSLVKDRRVMRFTQPDRMVAAGTEEVRIHPGLDLGASSDTAVR